MIQEALHWLSNLASHDHPAPLFQVSMLADPYPTYHWLRTEDPVHWDAVESRWVLSRYADVQSFLRSPGTSAQRSQAFGRFVPPAFRRLAKLREASMINNDAPRHNRLRTLVSKAFTARAIDALTDKIRALVDGFLDVVQERKRMDVIADLAYPLPVTVIAEMLGIPPKDRDKLKGWSDQLAIVAGGAGGPAALKMEDYRRLSRSYDELTAYLSVIVAQRRAEPRDDLLSALVQAEEAGDRLSEDELYANATLILVAGHETTTNLIGNGTLALMRHRDQWQRLVDDPSLIPTAVEELLRYDSPVQFTARVLKEDFELEGKQLQKGQVALLLLASANRDAEQFADSDQLDVGRADNKHLAFGLGSHYCLGAQLARLEGRLVFEALVRRMPNLQLADPEPIHREHYNLRGLRSLPVTF